MPQFVPVVLLSTLCLLGACSTGNYDSEREWRLRECEKILDSRDRENCRTDTPHYEK